jgi:plastocyanin
MVHRVGENDSRQQPARSRRRFVQVLAAASGGVLLLQAGLRFFAINVFAQDEDNSGSGSSDGRGRGRGRGGRDEDEEPDDEDVAAQVAEVPTGSLEIRIVSDDAGGFVPAELTIDQGQSVSFVNAHDDEHTATGSGFDTGIIQPGAVATITLDTPGRFAYACQIHPEMTGSIAVRDATGNVPEAAAAAAASPADATTVAIANLAFDPAQISVQPGATVAWTNGDSVPHTVTAVDGAFDSGIFDPGANFTWTFDQPGSFDYACQLHPQMQGTVTVGGEAAAGETTAQPAGGAEQAVNLPAGTWLLEFTPAASTIFGAQAALLTFHENGTVAADFAASIASSAQSVVLGVGHGEWEQREDEVGFAIAALVEDADGQFVGLLTLNAEASFDTTARAVDGTFAFELTAADGDSLGSGSGTLSGTRIELGDLEQ